MRGLRKSPRRIRKSGRRAGCSPDWMRRNLYRRIEAVTPILDEDLKQQLIDMLVIQLKDNRKAGWVDENLNNVLKRNPKEEPVRAQYAFYEYLKGKNK